MVRENNKKKLKMDSAKYVKLTDMLAVRAAAP